MRQNTSRDCAQSQKRSTNCKRRFRSQSIRGWRIISSAKVTIKRWNIWKPRRRATEHRHLACAPSGPVVRCPSMSGNCGRSNHEPVRPGPDFLFHTNRIDQIATATAVACTDRSKGRWKQTNEQIRKRKRSREKPSTSTNKPYELTNQLHHIRPPHLTSYIGVRPLASI